MALKRNISLVGGEKGIFFILWAGVMDFHPTGGCTLKQAYFRKASR